MATTKPQLPNPATAKTPTTTLNGVTYYLRTGAGATPQWLTVGAGNKMFPVDLSGKQVPGKSAVFNTEAEWAKTVNTAIQPKPTAASVGATVGATSPDLLAYAKTLGFNDVASYNAALKASNAAGFGNDVNKYQIAMAAEAAKKTAASKATDAAKAKAAADAKAVSDAAAARAAEAKRLEQEQIAKAQAEYEAAEAQRQAAQVAQDSTSVTPVVPVLKGTALTAKQTEFTNRLRQAQTQDEFDTIVSQSAAVGAPLNQGIVDSLQKTLTGKFQTAETQRLAQLSQQYQTQLGQATTQADVDRIIAEARTAGAPINQGIIDSKQTALTQQAQAVEQQRVAQLSQQYQTQLGQAQTQEQFDSIVKQARDAGAAVNTGFVDQSQKSLTQNLQAQAQKAAAAEQARIQSEQVGLSLPAPGTEQFGYSVANGFDVTAPDGTVYRAVPQNLTTGQPGGWYQSKDSGSTWTNWQDGRAQGPAIPQKEFQQQIQSIGQSNASFTQQQETAAREQESIQNLAGQQRYAAAYQQLQSSGQPFTSQDIVKLGNQQAEATFQQQQSESEALKAESRERVQNQINPDYGPFDELLYATLAVVAIGAVAGAAGASLGSLGTTAGAEGAALAGEAATTAGTMAQGGASAAEIAGVMESTYGMSSTVAGELAATASGAVNGVVSAGELVSTLASSGVTPEMMAIANGAGAVDGIAALNALTGWTGSDMAYLASIGMPEAVMGAAAAANAVFGLPTTVEGWAAATEVAGGAGAGAGAGSGPVAPGAAVDTSQMIPAYDAAGNVGYMDPATGNFYTESGQLISEGSSGFTGPGTEYASANTGTVTDVGVGSGQGPGETFTQIFDDGSQLITDAAGNPVGGLDSAGNAFSVNPETGAGFYPETGLPTAGAGGGGGAPVVPTESAGISNITDAQFVAEDAAQLAKQGLSQSQIESTLLFSGVDPLVAADAAALASSGLGAGAIAPALEQSGAAIAGGAPEIFTSIPGGIAEPLPGYAGPPGSAPIYGTNVPAPVYDYSTPYVAGNEPTLAEGLKSLGGAVKEALPSLGVTDALALVGAANVLGPIIAPPPKVEEYQYGPLAPIEWGKVGTVNAPGLNPGLMVPAPADYQTTSPVQSKFYYGPRPYQAGTTFDPALYSQVPKPAQPYGLQQAFFETPQSYDQYQFRPYGPDLTLTDPLTTTYQPVVPQPLR